MSRRQRARASGRISRSVFETLEERRMLSFSVTVTEYGPSAFGNVVASGYGTSTMPEASETHDAAIIGIPWGPGQVQYAEGDPDGTVTAPGLAGSYNNADLTDGKADHYLVGFGDGSSFRVTGESHNPNPYFVAYGDSYLFDFNWYPDACVNKTGKPVRYADGAPDFSTDWFTDDSGNIPTDVDWTNEGAGADPSSVLSVGRGMQMGNLPYIQDITPSTGDVGTVLDQIIGISLGAQDQEYAIKAAGMPFVLSNQAPQKMTSLVRNTATNNDRYIITLGDGTVMSFFGFNLSTGEKHGQLESISYPGGAVRSTNWDGGVMTGQTWTDAGDTVSEHLDYTYEEGTNRVASITLSRDTGGGSVAVQSVALSYYGSSEDNGNDGELKYAVLHEGDVEGDIIQTQYYRWYKSGEENGYEHGLKLWLSGDSYLRAKHELGSVYNVEHAADFDGSGNPVLAAYADNMFMYDHDTHAVTYERAQDSSAGCSCGLTGIGMFKLDYETNDDPGTGQNAWLTKTTEYLPDSTNDIPTHTLSSGNLTSSSTTATVQWTANGFDVGDEIKISGASQDEYNGTFKITDVFTNSFTYTFGGSGTSPATGTIKVENLSQPWKDNDQNIVYTNKWGQPILKVFQDTSEDKQFPTWNRYDAAGRVVMTAEPSAVSGFDPDLPDLVGYDPTDGSATYLRDDAGLVEVTSYYVSNASPNTTGEYYLQDTVSGGLVGYEHATYLQRGDDVSTAVKQEEWTYTDGAIDDDGVFFVSTDTKFTGGDGDDPAVTTYEYASWYTDGMDNPTNQVKDLITHLPEVSDSQNGADSVLGDSSDIYISETVFDKQGRPIWTKDASGSINYYEYETITGAQTKSIVDVDTDDTGDFTDLPDGWSSPDGLHLKTLTNVDLWGRPIKQTDPKGNVTYTTYDDSVDDGDPRDIRIYKGWNSGTHLPTGPVQVVLEDPSIGIRDTLSFTWTDSGGLDVNGNGAPTGVEDLSSAFAHIQSLTRETYNVSKQVVKRDDYFNLGGLTYSLSSLGSSSNDTSSGNYHETTFKYDDRGRQWRTVAPTGTITNTIFDGLGRAVSTAVGTDDSVNSSNMRTIAEYEYDNGDIGDGNLTKETDKPDPTDSGKDRVTKNWYDWRDRLVATKAGVQASESGSTSVQRMLTYYTYDNGDQVTSATTYDADNVTISSSTDGVPDAPSHSYRRALQTFEYDDQGRQFASHTFSVDPADGEDPYSGSTDPTRSLNTLTWYDTRGNVIKTAAPGGLVTKNIYDGADRLAKTYSTDGNDDNSWSDATTVNDDVQVALLSSNTFGVTFAGGHAHQDVPQMTASYSFTGGTSPGITVTTTTAGSATANEVQQIQITGTPTGGTFTLTFDGHTTSAIAYNASASTIQSDLLALSNIGTGDTVLEQTEYQYDANGNSIFAIGKQRFHDATHTGELGDPSSSGSTDKARVYYAEYYYDALDRLTGTSNLGTNGGSVLSSRPDGTLPLASDTKLTTSNEYQTDEIQTVQVTGSPTGGSFELVFDGQPTATIAYNASASTVLSDLIALSNIDSGDVTVTAGSSPNIYVVKFTGAFTMQNVPQLTTTSISFSGGTAPSVSIGTTIDGSSGWLSRTTDPRGISALTNYDMLGRTTSTIAAYTDGVPSNADDQTTAYTYDGDDHVLTMKAVLPSDTFQETRYIYAANTDDGSDVDNNDILSAIQYPDVSTGEASSSDQQETFTNNAFGERTSHTDRNGTTHSYSYNVLGRLTFDDVTGSLGSGVNDAVTKLGYTFNTQGLPEQFTSYDGDGNVVNQVQRAYNGLGQLVTEYQEHSGAANTSTSAKVQYAYTEMASGANHSRLKNMTYPNGRIDRYEYSSGLDNNISRLSFVADDSSGSVGTHLEEYTYLGLSTAVKNAHPQPGVDLTYIKDAGDTVVGDAGDQYKGIDRFGRIIDQRWATSGGTDKDRFQHSYDRDSNALFTKDIVNSGESELYHANGASNGYDLLNRLTDFRRGTLSDANSDGVSDTVSTSSHTQNWSLDATGNWLDFTNDGFDPIRAHNLQNQITNLDYGIHSYDGNGNLIRNDAVPSFTYGYDAWNHLIAYNPDQDDTENPSETFAYDALGRRMSVQTHAPDTRSGHEGDFFQTGTHDLYYNSQWQVVEEHEQDSHISGSSIVTGSQYVSDQYVWSLASSDAVVERDRDSDANGSLDERLYSTYAANGNTTSLISTSGTVVARYEYDPDGTSTTSAGTDPDWIYLYQGGRYDAGSNLYDFRRRDYSPGHGRFIEPDPADYIDGSNLYAFVGDNPVTRTDPSGLAAASTIVIDLTDILEIVDALTAIGAAGEVAGAAALLLGATWGVSKGCDPHLGMGGHGHPPSNNPGLDDTPGVTPIPKPDPVIGPVPDGPPFPIDGDPGPDEIPLDDPPPDEPVVQPPYIQPSPGPTVPRNPDNPPGIEPVKPLDPPPKPPTVIPPGEHPTPWKPDTPIPPTPGFPGPGRA